MVGDASRDARRFYEAFGFAAVGRSAGAGGVSPRPILIRAAP